MAESSADKPFPELRAYLRRKRKEAGKRQEDVGDAVGLSHSVISNWERSVTTIPDTLPLILRGYLEETGAIRTTAIEMAVDEFQAWLDVASHGAYRNGSGDQSNSQPTRTSS